MSIDRYIVAAMNMTNAEDRGPALPHERSVVLYADHVAAVAAAQREGSNQGYLNGVATNVDNSFKAGVKAARDAVVASECWCGCDSATALAAIDALRETR